MMVLNEMQLMHCYHRGYFKINPDLNSCFCYITE